MNQEEHRAFIRSSLLDIVRGVVYSANMLGNGIEVYAVHEYLLQSLFLQMTGAQEQKMKCVCWELATDNYEYRYQRYYQKWALSECSTLGHKSAVYADLLHEITSHDETYKPFNDDNEKKAFCNDIFTQIIDIFEDTNISTSQTQKFEAFKTWSTTFDIGNIVTDTHNVFKMGNKNIPFASWPNDVDMFAIYDLLYIHRNSCAHNATSYQLNLPSLYKLRDDKLQRRDNIFMFFTALIMIDEIFRKLFAEYENLPKRA